jgi:2'-5' RNA ligase
MEKIIGRSIAMIKRCIMIFPEFKNIEKIEEIHIEKVTSDIEPFKLKLCGITGDTNNFGNYLFLKAQEGGNEIVQLHNRLYTGILKGFYNEFLRKNGYIPHLTVGNLKEKNKFTQAVQDTSDFNEVFETVVNRVSVEIIDDNEDSRIEMDIPLLH